MKYKIFLSDFDGTLVREDGSVSQKNRAAIAEYTKKGGVFAVCSGRMTASILPRVRELGLRGLVASFHGAVITEIETGKILKCSALENELAYEIIRKLEASGYHTHIYTAEKMYCNVDDEALKFYESVCRVKAEIRENLYEFAKSNRLQIVKAVVFVDKDERVAAEERIKKIMPQNCCVSSSAEYLVEVTLLGENKGEAVKFLSEYYNVPIEKIAAIGDMGNDLPMIAAVGGKFAVENAVEELKSIATVVPSCEDDGVAEALKRAMED